MAKFNFTIESDNMEQDLAKLVEVFVDAYEKCSKIDERNTTNEVQKQVHSLDNRIDSLEAMIKSGNFNEVESSTKKSK